MYQYPFFRHFISPTFLFSVSFPYWAKLRIIIGREKVPSSLLFWPKNDWRKTNLLPCGQTALATVWKVLSRYGTCQNLRKNCASKSTSFCSIWCTYVDHFICPMKQQQFLLYTTLRLLFLLFRMAMTPLQRISTWLKFKRSLIVYFLLFTNIRQWYCVNISWSKKMIGSQEPSMSRGLYECNPLKDMN